MPTTRPDDASRTIIQCVEPQVDEGLARARHSARTLDGVPEIDMTTMTNNPANVQRAARIVTRAAFETVLFPVRDAIYTYEGFLQAIAKFPAFCGDDETGPGVDLDAACARELATTFAHFTQEVGMHASDSYVNPATGEVTVEARQGLFYTREIVGEACTDASDSSWCAYRQTCDPATWQGQAWPCAAGAMYYGRGAKQLSHNYNYGQFSKVMFDDVTVLLNDPDRVAREGWLALTSAVWFSLTPQGPKPSMHDVSRGVWTPNAVDAAAGLEALSFGATTVVINGAFECGRPAETAQSANRIKYFAYFSARLGVVGGGRAGCAATGVFSAAGSAGAVKAYWARAWSGLAPACQQVQYQGADSVLVPTGYADCVEREYPDVKCAAATPLLAKRATVYDADVNGGQPVSASNNDGQQPGSSSSSSSIAGSVGIVAGVVAAIVVVVGAATMAIRRRGKSSERTLVLPTNAATTSNAAMVALPPPPSNDCAAAATTTTRAASTPSHVDIVDIALLV